MDVTEERFHRRDDAGKRVNRRRLFSRWGVFGGGEYPSIGSGRDVFRGDLKKFLPSVGPIFGPFQSPSVHPRGAL